MRSVVSTFPSPGWHKIVIHIISVQMYTFLYMWVRMRKVQKPHNLLCDRIKSAQIRDDSPCDILESFWHDACLGPWQYLCASWPSNPSKERNMNGKARSHRQVSWTSGQARQLNGRFYFYFIYFLKKPNKQSKSKIKQKPFISGVSNSIYLSGWDWAASGFPQEKLCLKNSNIFKSLYFYFLTQNKMKK